MIKRLANKAKFITYRVVMPLVIKSLYPLRSSNDKKLLVIKNDGIGDYILFRNYLVWLKQSEIYKGHKLYLLVNQSFKKLAVDLDSEVADGFYEYADDFFLKWKMVKLLAKLQKLRPTTIIYPNYSRKSTTDWLVNNINAPHKITVEGLYTNASAEALEKGDKYYTKIVSIGKPADHEFIINRKIVDAIISENSDIARPFFGKNLQKKSKSNQVIVFPGASDGGKKWPLENFEKICRQLLLQNDLEVILTGGPAETSDCKMLMKNLGSARVTNQAGKATLTQLSDLIGGARLLITNDTVAGHMAVAHNTPAVCIAKGDYYGRFVPYPEEMKTSVRCVLPPQFVTHPNSYFEQSPCSIAEVPVADVMKTVMEMLNNAPKHEPARS